MKRSKSMIVFAAIGSVICASSAIAEDKVAVAAPEAAEAQVQKCEKLKTDIVAEGAGLRKIEAVKGDNDCEFDRQFERHTERQASFFESCGSVYGLTQEQIRDQMINSFVSGKGVMQGCPSPK